MSAKREHCCFHHWLIDHRLFVLSYPLGSIDQHVVPAEIIPSGMLPAFSLQRFTVTADRLCLLIPAEKQSFSEYFSTQQALAMKMIALHR